MTKRTQIYIYLQNEGTDVWRPVDAEGLGENVFRITSENSDPEDEQWQFSTGDVVRCETKQLSEGDHLVAVEKVQ